MNKLSTKIIFFAASMHYSVRSIQVLKERLSKNLMKYGFNNWYAIVNDDKFWFTIRFSEKFLHHLFQPHQWLPDRKRIILDAIC